MTENPAFDRIQQTIDSHDVVLFMKGSKKIPQCGFSNTVTQMLQHLEVDFQDVNVLADQEVREGIKAFSDWPTIPQLYVKGEFVGGQSLKVLMPSRRPSSCSTSTPTKSAPM